MFFPTKMDTLTERVSNLEILTADFPGDVSFMILELYQLQKDNNILKNTFDLQKKSWVCFTVYFGMEILNQKHLQKYPRLQKIGSYAALVPLCLGVYYALQ
jgi:hypothetical protein